MGKWLIFFCLLGAPAWGQSMVQAGSDTIELREPTPDCHCIGLLVYSNGISNFSQGGDYTVTLGDLEVRVRIEVSGGPEILHVYAYEQGMMALDESGEAVEAVTVTDGDVSTIRILPGMM